MMTISERANSLMRLIRAMWRWTSANCFSGSVHASASVAASGAKKNKPPERVPLQPLRTSMPSTCRAPNCQKIPNVLCRESTTQQLDLSDFKQLIPRVVLPYNEKSVRRICAESLARICNEYSINTSISTLQKLAEFAADPEQSNNSIVALFFLCLDIDIQLKEIMINSESDSTKRKLTNFFTNLRNNVIPGFLCEEEVDADELVSKCYESYMLA